MKYRFNHVKNILRENYYNLNDLKDSLCWFEKWLVRIDVSHECIRSLNWEYSAFFGKYMVLQKKVNAIVAIWSFNWKHTVVFQKSGYSLESIRSFWQSAEFDLTVSRVLSLRNYALPILTLYYGIFGLLVTLFQIHTVLET